MTIIKNLFAELSDEKHFYNKCISMHIRKGLKKNDLDLTKKQIDSIVEAVLVRSTFTDIDLLLSKKQIKNSIYDNAFDASKGIESILERYLEDLSENAPANDFEKLKDDYLQKYLKKVESTTVSFLKKTRKDKKSFEKRLDLLWGHPLDLLEVLIHLATEAGANYQNIHPFLSSDEYFIYQALLRLHAKACQTSLEILILLKSGFADGAIARWRLLYEIDVMGLFLKKHGNETAERFLDYSHVTSYLAQKNYQEHASRLGYESYTEKEMADSLEKINDFDEKYGRDFKKSGYGWAGQALNKSKPTFADIEKDADKEYTRPFYKRASSSIHVGAKGLFNQYGIYPGDDVLLAGASNVGLADPCIYTAIYLNKITANFIIREEESNVASLIAILMITNLQDKIEDSANEISSEFKFDQK